MSETPRLPVRSARGHRRRKTTSRRTTSPLQSSVVTPPQHTPAGAASRRRSGTSCRRRTAGASSRAASRRTVEPQSGSRIGLQRVDPARRAGRVVLSLAHLSCPSVDGQGVAGRLRQSPSRTPRHLGVGRKRPTRRTTRTSISCRAPSERWRGAYWGRSMSASDLQAAVALNMAVAVADRLTASDGDQSDLERQGRPAASEPAKSSTCRSAMCRASAVSAAAICSRICGSVIVPSGPTASRVTGTRTQAASTMSAWT